MGGRPDGVMPGGLDTCAGDNLLKDQRPGLSGGCLVASNSWIHTCCGKETVLVVGHIARRAPVLRPCAREVRSVGLPPDKHRSSRYALQQCGRGNGHWTPHLGIRSRPELRVELGSMLGTRLGRPGRRVAARRHETPARTASWNRDSAPVQEYPVDRYHSRLVGSPGEWRSSNQLSSVLSSTC